MPTDWIDESLYILILFLTKASILFFYLRVFVSRRFQLSAKVTLAFVISSGMAFLIAQLLQCLPVRYNWDKSLPTAKCINVNALAYAHASVSIAQDFIILILPIPELLSLLKLDRHQKIGLFIMFQVGIL